MEGTESSGSGGGREGGDPSPGPSDVPNRNKFICQSLPHDTISRIMKRALPDDAEISKEAVDSVQKCAAEFISYVTGEASEICKRGDKRAITSNALIESMTTLGFVDYVDALTSDLKKDRDMEVGGNFGDLSAYGVQHGQKTQEGDYFHDSSVVGGQHGQKTQLGGNFRDSDAAGSQHSQITQSLDYPYSQIGGNISVSSASGSQDSQNAQVDDN